MMTVRRTLLLALPLFACVSVANAAPTDGCAIKAQEIEEQIKHARLHGNTHRVAGLETALDKVNRYCTEEKLQADRQAGIAEKQRDVAQREQELREAKATGRADKIAKREEKLAEAQAELAEALAE